MKQQNRNKLLFVGSGLSESSESILEESSWTCRRKRDVSPYLTRTYEGWEQAAREAATELAKILHNRTQGELRYVALSARFRALENKVSEVQSRACITVPIQSVAPEPFDLVHAIHVVVQQSGEDFSATFFDANINASGETQEEAVTNLKDLLVATFEALESMPEKLGPGPKRQLAVLKQFLRRNAECASSPKSTP